MIPTRLQIIKAIHLLKHRTGRENTAKLTGLPFDRITKLSPFATRAEKEPMIKPQDLRELEDLGAEEPVNVNYDNMHP